MRILHIAETIKGGVATYLELLYSNVPHEHHFLIPASQAHEINIDRAHLTEFPGQGRLQRVLGLFGAISNICHKHKYDIIHLHSSFAGYIFLLKNILRKNSPAVVFCAHGWSFQRQVSKAERTICKIADYVTGRFSTGIIHISKTEQAAASFIPCSLQAPIYNPISNHYLSPLKKQNNQKTVKNILFVGRLDHQKGFDILYEAFKSKELENFNLLVAGDAVLSGSNYKPTGNVNFLGWISKTSLIDLYENSDLTIIPSRWEGFGFVAIESLARGTPVLSSRAGSLPEILGEYGQITEMRSAKEVIRAIIQYRTRAEEAPSILQNYVRKNFSPELFSEKISEFYKKAVDKKTASPHIEVQNK